MDYTTTQAFETSQMHINDFEFHDFINETNFEQFFDLIREEIDDPINNYTPTPNYYEEQVDELMFNDNRYNQQFFSAPEDLFGFNYSASTASNPNSINNNLNFVPPFSVDIEGLVEENDGSYSSETTKTRPTSNRPTMGVDNSRILTSERRRRIRLKEKLYSLRALVPNITKMDKASIIGDAVSYVQGLQMQAKKLKAEIAELESSTNIIGTGMVQNLVENPKKTQKHPICRKILQMDVFQVEENVFYVRLVCNKEEGVAVALYKAIETLTSFDVQCSNFATFSETLVFTFMINVKECREDMNLSSLKLWVNRALLNQGFEYKLNN
ncbi:Myc-type [Macleaya cordata]|uniref:Myc-type n=1 Tax=Macleaya cordata TaxID=56857 RepID=A0A200R9W2_MACCD|nr:Myc-type [Macleaya cordata]